MLFAKLLQHLVKVGQMTLIDATGKEHQFSGAPGPSVTVRLHDKKLHTKLFVNPRLYVGEAFMDGTLTVEKGTIYDFLYIATANMAQGGWHPAVRWVNRIDAMFRRIQQYNPARRARKNVAHHYDLSSDLYDLFLDEDHQYSCAYFDGPDDSLDAAQWNKKRHLAAKLAIEPGMKVLDIGCGWGGLALYLAQETGAHVTGLTLSEEQLKGARARAEAMGLADKVDFQMRDYRDETTLYDRVVSVGMFEHVGINHYQTYFDKVRDCLTEDGIAVIHTIGQTDSPGATNPWVRKYIFPGGYCPSLSEMMPPIERSGLVTNDVEVLRLHYAETLRHWRDRFMANRDAALALYDERFCRMWEFYLSACEVAFRNLGQVVFQVQLSRKQEAVPLTRDYITEWEKKANRKRKRRQANDNKGVAA